MTNGFLWVGLLALGLALFGPVEGRAQDSVWVQIEARPNVTSATERAEAWSERLANVAGFRLPSGWYAIALGPYPEALAAEELARLRAERRIPRDSYLARSGAFREQFWPPFGQIAALPLPSGTPDTAAPAPVAATDETPAEARAAERRLTRTEREEVQRALQVFGFYRSAIDGAFGPGTRRAMAAWQADRGLEPTGVLTSAQRADLLGSLREIETALGLETWRDAEAGIEIDLPLGLVDFTGHDAPFAKFAGNGVEVLLISQTGDADSLAALYEVMQTLEIVPLDGPREVNRQGFRLTGANDRIETHVQADLSRGAVKGFALAWPRGDALRQRIALEAMRASFRPLDGVLPDTAGSGAEQRPDLLAGLQIRQPEISASGVYVDRSGTVLTALDTVRACGRITLNGDQTATLGATDADAGLALLRPAEASTPLGVARFADLPPRLMSEIAVAGYSYGGLLGAPTLSFGTFEDVRGLDGEPGRDRLSLTAQPGDAGGPVLDSTGEVVGLLLPRGAADRGLPADVRFTADLDRTRRFLAENGVAVEASGATPDTLDPVDITRIGADMTVLVECWN